MCGITGAFYAQNIAKRTRDPLSDAWNLYQDQESRGNKGFGASIIAPDLGVKTLRATTEASIAVDMRLWNLDVLGVLFHHRWPTSTENTLATTHPFSIQSKQLRYRYLVAHNGVITNDDKVHADHVAKGYSYSTQDGESFLDSEASGIELARVIEGKKKLDTIGNQALVALQLDKKSKKAIAVYFVTNGGNPLSYLLKDGYLVMASELDGTLCTPSVLYRFDLATGKITTREISFAEYAKVEYKPVYSTKLYTSTMWKDKKGVSQASPVLERLEAESVLGASEPSPADLLTSDSEMKISETLMPLMEETEEIIDEYADALVDEMSCAIVSPDEYLRRLSLKMEEMKATALKLHTDNQLETSLA